MGESNANVSCNVYATVDFAGCSLTSKTIVDAHTASFFFKFRIPVTAPIYEDAILIKFWNKGATGDSVILQGRLSFSTLRTNGMPSRWFNFYDQRSDELSYCVGNEEGSAARNH